MKAADRHRAILDLVLTRDANVEQLSEALGVSEATVRRDLTMLAKERRLVRTYGGATALVGAHEPEASLEERKSFQPEVSCRILIDGLRLRNFPYPHDGFVKGDTRSLCIAMASIVAKVARDRLMCELDLVVPGYGFAQHKGYG